MFRNSVDINRRQIASGVLLCAAAGKKNQAAHILVVHHLDTPALLLVIFIRIAQEALVAMLKQVFVDFRYQLDKKLIGDIRHNDAYIHGTLFAQTLCDLIGHILSVPDNCADFLLRFQRIPTIFVNYT